jgi:glutamine amidotransferase
LAILGAGAEEDPVGATRRTLLRLGDMVRSGSEEDMLRFTAALSDGRSIYASCHAVKDDTNNLNYRTGDDETVIASEPLDGDHGRWTLVQEGHMLQVQPDRSPRIAAFLP